MPFSSEQQHEEPSNAIHPEVNTNNPQSLRLLNSEVKALDCAYNNNLFSRSALAFLLDRTCSEQQVHAIQPEVNPNSQPGRLLNTYEQSAINEALEQVSPLNVNQMPRQNR